MSTSIASRQPPRGSFPDMWIGVRRDWQQSSSLNRQLVEVTPHALRTHALIIGATGSGKTNLIHHLVAQDIRLGHSFCILDLRGDLVNACVQLLARRIDPDLVRIIDLRRTDRVQGFSPLAGAGASYFRALNVLDVIASEADSWGVQLAETLRNALMLLAEAREPMTRLEDLFYDPPFLKQCMNRCAPSPMLAFWKRFEGLSEQQKMGMAMPVLNKVSLLFATSVLRETLGHADPLDLASHLNRPGSVLLVSLAGDELHGAGRMMGRLILSSICREIFGRVSIPEHRRNPVRLYVDEFENFVLPEFETILAEGRKFKLSVILAHQTLAQLTSRLRSMILNNVGTKIVLRCGREDGMTLSRDLTGYSDDYDFSSFETGEAVVWRREHPIEHIEVNEPIVDDRAYAASHVRRFLEEVYAAIPESKVETASDHVPAPVKSPREKASGLEDWLWS